nr:MAG TPA: hyaluronase tail fiber protein [Caudoviricetes sp.]
MATVSGDIRLVSDSAAPVSQVWVSAPKIRAADGAIITAFHDRFDVRQGRVSFPCRPGPARVTLVSAGQPMDSLDILVPAEEAVSLWKAAQNFQIAGEESPETLMQYLDEIRRVGASVKADIGGAKQAVGQAKSHASKAEQARNAAQGHANTAQGHASTAQEHASDASGHASAAASSESEASKAAVRAEGARAEARTNWDKAAEAQAGAESARDDAQGHATTAQGHASNASTQATKSENAANRLWDSVSWRGDRLSVAGRQSESLTGPQGPPGPAGTVDGLEPETIVRTGAQDTRLGKYLTVDATDQGQASASLFLKKNDHWFEFFTNAAGKFGAWDKRYSRGLFQADRNAFDHQTAVNMGNNQLRGLPAPSANDHAANKQYVDSVVENVSVDTSGLAPRSHQHPISDVEGLQAALDGKAATGDIPANVVQTNSEPTFGRKVDMSGDGSAYTIFKMTSGSRSVEQYLTSGGDLGFYDGSNRFVSKRDVFEHHTATDMRGNELKGLRAPTADNHAATKAYVDATVSGVRDSVGELQSRIQLVDSLPSNPDSQTLYLIAE